MYILETLPGLEQPLINEVVDFLKERGFRIIGLENVSRNKNDGTFLQADAIFIKSTESVKTINFTIFVYGKMLCLQCRHLFLFSSTIPAFS